MKWTQAKVIAFTAGPPLRTALMVTSPADFLASMPVFGFGRARQVAEALIHRLLRQGNLVGEVPAGNQAHHWAN
jgi:hypothetical protein